MKRTKLAEHWTKQMAAWSRSGLGVKEFCAREGVSRTTFFKWRKRLEKSDGEAAVAPPEFVEIGNGVEGAAIEVEMPGGFVVRVRRGFDAKALRALLGLLREQR